MYIYLKDFLFSANFLYFLYFFYLFKNKGFKLSEEQKGRILTGSLVITIVVITVLLFIPVYAWKTTSSSSKQTNKASSSSSSSSINSSGGSGSVEAIVFPNRNSNPNERELVEPSRIIQPTSTPQQPLTTIKSTESTTQPLN